MPSAAHLHQHGLRRRWVAVLGSALSVGAVACGGESTELELPPVETEPVDTGAETEVGNPVTLQGALAEFGKCMSLEVWVQTGIYQLYKAETVNNQSCGACHVDNTGGAALSDDVVWAFQENTRLPSIMRLVTGTVDQRGNFATLVPSNRYIDKGVEPCPEGVACHPRYALPPHLQKAVATFVEVTLDRWRNGTRCDAPYLPEE